MGEAGGVHATTYYLGTSSRYLLNLVHIVVYRWVREDAAHHSITKFSTAVRILGK
jgi:hypothetical protein